jgi:hypothetical protein
LVASALGAHVPSWFSAVWLPSSWTSQNLDVDKIEPAIDSARSTMLYGTILTVTRFKLRTSFARGAEARGTER